MDLRAIFSKAIAASEELPRVIRENVRNVTALETHIFDVSYLNFLDEQTRVEPRGPEWSERLRRRRTALSPFVNRVLIRGAFRTFNSYYTIEVDPDSERVVHWEKYDEQMESNES